MKLTVPERYVLQGVLPAESSFVTMRLVKNLRDALALEEDEIKRLGVVIKGDQITWNAEVDGEGTEIQVGELAGTIVRDALRQMDKSNKLTVQHLTLYEKFLGA